MPKAISKRLRYEALRRDRFACRYCGLKATEGTELVVDHVVPRALGGETVLDNLAAACQPCNAGKTSTVPDDAVVAAVAADTERLRQIDERVRARKPRQDMYAGFEQEIDAFTYEWNRWEPPAPMGDSPSKSLRVWFLKGATLEFLNACAEIAWNKPLPPGERWRYFCGVVWRSLEQQEQAKWEAFDAAEEPEIDTLADQMSDRDSEILWAVSDAELIESYQQ